jgi:hypothetical protein
MEFDPEKDVKAARLARSRVADFAGDLRVGLLAMRAAEKWLSESQFWVQVRNDKRLLRLRVSASGKTLGDAADDVQVRECLIDGVLAALLRHMYMASDRLSWLHAYLAVNEPIPDGGPSAYTVIMGKDPTYEPAFKAWFEKSAKDGLFIYLMWMEKSLAENGVKYTWPNEYRVIGGEVAELLRAPA